MSSKRKIFRNAAVSAAALSLVLHARRPDVVDSVTAVQRFQIDVQMGKIANKYFAGAQLPQFLISPGG